MECKVLLFAQLADLAEDGCLTIQLPNGATVGDAMDMLCSEHGNIAKMRTHLAVAVDEVYKGPAAELEDGCTIALIPPVSGG